MNVHDWISARLRKIVSRATKTAVPPPVPSLTPAEISGLREHINANTVQIMIERAKIGAIEHKLRENLRSKK